MASTSSGRCRSPANISAYARATRAGVSCRPSRSGSSPIAIRISRTAASARAWSKSARPRPGRRSGVVIGSVTRQRCLAPGRAAWGRPAARPAVAVDVATGPGRRDDHAGALRARSASAPLAATRSRISCGISTGGMVDGLRVGEPVQAGRFGAGASASKTSATCCLVERLLLEQRQHQGVEHVAVLLQDVERLLVGVGEQLGDLLVDDRGDVLGVVAVVADVAAQERLGVVGAELDRAQPLGHAVLGDHRPGQVGGLLDVVAGAGGRVVEDHLLRRPAAHHVGELVEQLGAGLGVLVLVRQHHRVAEGPAARQDRDLVHRVGAGQRRRDQGVSALVVGGDRASPSRSSAGCASAGRR